MNSTTLLRASRLCQIAKAKGVNLTPRMRRDWTDLGLLAPATAEGRPGESGGGVGRYWTAEQVIVFEAVLDRYRAREPRRHLANVPVAFWLLLPDGDDYVALPQVRRALATFASAAWTRERIADVARRRVLASPALTDAAPELVKRVEGLVENDLANMPADADALPGWLATLPRDDVSRQSAAEIRAEAEAGRRGLNVYMKASNDAYRAARQRYREWAFRYPPSLTDRDRERAFLQRRYDELRDNACADLLIALGEVTLSSAEPRPR